MTRILITGGGGFIGQKLARKLAEAGTLRGAPITRNRDPVIEKNVPGWRGHVRPEKALRLGFTGDPSFADSARRFLEDDHRDRPA